MSIKKLYFSFIAIIATTFSLAQVYPVQVNSTVLPPYLSTVASYSTTINQKYLVNIFTADLTTVNRQARLKLYIEGNGIQAQSQSVVNGATPIYLNGGETLSLSNLDLAPYFQIENLQGITPTQYANVLPEGNYKFCIEVYDYLTNQRISQKSCTFYYFLYNQPPLLNLPQNHSVVFYQDPQNIIFTWTPRHINATNIEYLFELVELLDNQAPSNYAFMVGAPIYSTTVSNTILHYGPAETQLIAGRKYAWRVKAQSQPGFGETAVFNNNGYSEIFDFVYPGNCEAPKFVLASSLNATQAKITWEPDPKHLDYKVEYRKQGTDTWFTTAYYNNEAKIYDLEPGATYEFRVGGECLGNSITYSNVNTFTQPTTNTSALNCGIQPNIDLSNQSLFTGQLPNDQVIMAGDFSIKLTEVTGTGSYTGKGYTTVPYLSFVKIGVEFTDIKINTDFKLVQGEIKASYDPEWNNIIDVASIYDQIENIFDVFSPDTDEHSYQVDFVIPNASSIQVNGNSVVVTGPNGETHTFDLDPGEMIIIRDQNGNVYGVPPGSDHAVALDPTKEDAAGFIPSKDNTEGLSSNGSVTAFSNVGARVSFQRATNNPDNKNSQFADDVKPTNAHSNIAKLYKSIADGNANYDFYHKGIQNDGKASRSTDFVEAIIDITDASIKADSIQFNIKGSKAKKVATKTVGNKTHFVLEVPVFETAQTFELLALLKPNSSGDKNKVIGAAKIIPIKIQQEVNVTVVPVNGADIPTNIESQLNAIYDDAAVKFKITLAPNYEVAKTTIECDKDYLLEKLSADQSSFIDTYKQGKDIKKDQYYVFITKNITPSKSISGFMPRHSQFGFVFTNQSGAEAKASSDLATIVAHELGHGVFELKHPWSEFTTGDRNSNTPWLMDYTAGTKLPYVHWQRISHPKFGLYVFDGSGQGELANQLQGNGTNLITFNFDNEPSIFYINGFDNNESWKVTFLNSNVQKIDEKEFKVTENGVDKTIRLFYRKSDNRPIFVYKDLIKDITPQSNGFYQITEDKYYKEGVKYAIEPFKYDLNASQFTQLKSKLNHLTSSKKAEILKLIVSVPWDEVSDLCSTNDCFDLLNKQYSDNEWNTIIQLLQVKKNAIQSITYLPVNEQLLTLKNLILSSINQNKICRLVISGAQLRNEIQSYEEFEILYQGINNNAHWFKVKLKQNFIQDKVSRFFYIAYPINSDIINTNDVAFTLSIPNKTETITLNNFPKGIQPSVATANALSQGVLAAALVMSGAPTVGELFLSSTLFESFVANQGRDCLKYVAFDIAIQLIINEIFKKYGAGPIDFSYSSLPVSCVSAYLPDTTILACNSGMIAALGDDIIYNLNQTDPTKIKKADQIIDHIATDCLFNVAINVVLRYSSSKVTVFRKAFKWYLFNKTVTKTLTTAEKSLVGDLLENYASKIDKTLLKNIINAATDDLSKVLNTIKTHLDDGGKIEEIDQIVYLIDKDNNKLSKFIDGKWEKIVTGAGRFIAKSGNELKTYLNAIVNKPLGKSYNGDMFRSLSKSSETNFGALPNQMTDHHIYSSWGRYDLAGEENAMYLSKTVTGNQTELVPHYGAWNDFSTYKYTNVQADNLLDLTDDVVRQQLGTEFEQLTKVLDDKAVMYEFTNELAKWARQKGYNGLIVPGARGAKDYQNVIIFEQAYVNQILQGKTAISIPK